MYRNFFALERRPFDLTPDPNTLFLSESHKEGLAMLKYGVLSEKSFLMLTGGVGTGKTTLVNTLVEDVKDSHYPCLIANPSLSVVEFYALLVVKLGLAIEDRRSAFHLAFATLLERSFNEGRKVLLIIDEAHLLSLELLEEIRLLGNLSSGNKNSLGIFLVGQPELLERLKDKRLLPLRHRISQRYHLDPLTHEETDQYIKFRIRAAGGHREDLFTKKACKLLHKTTNGNPRVINILCDNGLLQAFSSGKNQVDEEIIKKCIEQYLLPGEVLEGTKPKQSFLSRFFFQCLFGALALEGALVWYLADRGYLGLFWRTIKQVTVEGVGPLWGI